MRHWLKQLYRTYSPFTRIEHAIELNRLLIAQIRLHQLRSVGPIANIAQTECRVFSQWGEDGIIQYLISHVEIAEPAFVEIGAGDYRESNTRFLLVNNHWRGLVVDCQPDAVRRIRHTELHWREDLTALAAFVTRENVNEILQKAGFTGDIGLLSIDIDGNDYWLWESIEAVSPRIVVIEYNSVFGRDAAVTIPYAAHFRRDHAHYSHLYFGASLKALCLLGRRKGYTFVGCNSTGVNAFFVRTDVAGGVAAVDWREGYVRSRARESRDQRGRLSYVGGKLRRSLIAAQLVFDVETSAMRQIGDLPE